MAWTERGDYLRPDYDRLDFPQFVEIILHDVKQRDEAVYYLLHHRMNRQLREIYFLFHRNLLDDFEDVIDDFFLYLREGKDGRNRMPYQSIQDIKSIDSFEAWLLNTFRNYLSNRVKEEEYMISSDVPSDNLFVCSDQSSSLSDEEKLHVASCLIAYALQVYYPRGRYIFLRMLLTMLNKQKALPNEEVAIALGMTNISYRVAVHRVKRNLAMFRQRLLQGEQFRLDDQHQQIARQLFEEFECLYPTLMAFYVQTIDSLKCADAIKRLRQQYYESTGIVAHEPDLDYPVRTTISAFWNKLNRLLLV